jgi:hypothetical protein
MITGRFLGLQPSLLKHDIISKRQNTELQV